MLTKHMKTVLDASQEQGWVLEPDAKALLAEAGMAVPEYRHATRLKDAVCAAEAIGYPVVGKVVSPRILHKSDCGGVIAGIDGERKLKAAFHQFRSLDGFTGMLVEQMLSGVELIIGAKMDYQFGPVILLGMGGTGVEVYQDTTLRMAPITGADVTCMINGLKARRYVEGYRGSSPVNIEKLTEALLTFSRVVLALEGRFESIDLNPVICSPTSCVVADARIMLKGR